MKAKAEKTVAAFWQSYLQDFATRTSLPGGRKAEVKVGQTRDYESILPPGTEAALNQFLQENALTAEIFFYAVWGILLQRYNFTDDVVFGIATPGQCRDQQDGTALSSSHIELKPLRLQSNPTENVRVLVEALASNVKEIQQYPMVEEAEGLFDSLILVESTPPCTVLCGEVQQAPGHSLQLLDLDSFELVVAVTKGATWKIQFIYETSLLEDYTVWAVAKHFAQIIQEIVLEPARTISALEMIIEEEKRCILQDFQGQTVDYLRDQTLMQIFEAQVERTPEKIAVIYENESLTYCELNAQANQLARVLQSKGVQAEQIVGLMVERSPEMLVAIFAILKAGGAYLPIDPHGPEERIQYMLADSEARLLLTQQRFLERVNYSGEWINIEDSSLYAGSDANLANIADPHNLAYIIYTSGSTGKPKGVMVEHQSAVNNLCWRKKQFALEMGDVLVQKTAYTFDVSVWELFLWYFAGAAVVLLAPEEEKNPERIVKAIEKNRVTTIHFVPSMFNTFLYFVESRNLRHRLVSLRQIITSGEELQRTHIDLYQRAVNVDGRVKLYNLYGPTEATIDVTYFDCSRVEQYTSVPIGKPVFNTQLYIVDQHGNLQPPGVAGELCIAGENLARGYLHREEMTASKFVRNPFSATGKMYRTGDLARWFSDGEIEFLGRIDQQVKIRGYRVEIGEIENEILHHPAVKEVAVLLARETSQSEYLVAYVVATQLAPQNELTGEEIKDYLRKKLPGYMIPARYIFLDALPLNSSGKVDRKVLAASR